MGFVPDAQVAALAGLEDSSTLSDLVNAACGIAEDYTSRHFALTERVAQKMIAPGTERLLLGAYPVTQVSSVTLGGVETSGYTLDAECGIVTLDPISAPTLVKVTWTGGYAESDMLAPVVQAVAMIAAALNKTASVGGQLLQSERVGNWSGTYWTANGATGLDALSIAAACLLRPYCARM